MTFTLVFQSICRLRWLKRHKSILLAEILNFQGAIPTLGVGSFSELCEEMSKYCGEVSYVDSIPYENLEADGLFVAWIGKVK